MKLDSNLAWQSAHAAIKGNRELLLALAGVFFLVPTLAFALLYPQPPMPAGMTYQQAAVLVQGFYREAFPFLVPIMLIQIVGAMAILTLFTDRTRPTVGGALGAGVTDSVVFLAAMLIYWLASGLVLGMVTGAFVLTGNASLVALATAIAFGAMLYCGLRLMLLMPVIAVEGLHNPLGALRRSWQLTRGNAARIFLFMLLLGVVYLIASTLVTAIAGLLLALLIGIKGGQIGVAVLTAALGAIFTLYVIAILAMIHRQLAGPSPAVLTQTFD
jgi:hypothetical protein